MDIYVTIESTTRKQTFVTDNYNTIDFCILTENNLRNAHSYCYSRMFYCSAVRSMVSDSLQLLTTKSMPTWEAKSYIFQGVSESMSKNWVQLTVVYPQYQCYNQCKDIPMSVEHWTPLTDHICFGIPKSLLRISRLTGIAFSFFHYFGIFT